MSFRPLSHVAILAFVLALGSTCALAAPLQVSLSNTPTTCQSTKITWDTSAGTAPWTVTVAPLGQVPISVSLPPNYMNGKTWSWDWNVPGYTTGVSSVIVAVSDSTGAVSGTSALSRLSKAGSCSAPQEQLDFVWFPPPSNPRQCDDWLLTVQEDHGNLGLKMPVDFLILPEKDVPTRLRITDARTNSIDWTVNYARGTNFVVAAFDAGTSGTGGVGGQAYTVDRGKSSSCIGANQPGAVAGLPAASSTAAPLPGASSTSAPSRMATSRVSSSATKTNAKTTATSTGAAAKEDAASEKSGPSSGVIGGAVGGVCAALAITGLALFFYRRQRNNRGPDEYGVYKSNEKRSFFGGLGSGRSANRGGFSGQGASGGRFGASTDRQGGISPFVTGRASPWRWSSRTPVGLSDSQDMTQLPDDRRAIANRVNNDGPRSMGHSSSISLHRSGDSISASGGVGLNLAPSVHSVVPDNALFPPPMPANRNVMPNHDSSTGNLGAASASNGASGVGSIGTKRHWTREASDSSDLTQHSDPFRNPTTPPKEAPRLPIQQQQQQQQQQRQHPASRDSVAAIGGLPLSPSSTYSQPGPATQATHSRDLTGIPPVNSSSQNQIQHQDLSTVRIPALPPVTTSLFDPYSHASRLFSDQDIGHLNAALAPTNGHNERANAATPASSSGSVARYADPKESAARFRTLDDQLRVDRDRVVSGVFGHDDDSSDEESGLPYMS